MVRIELALLVPVCRVFVSRTHEYLILGNNFESEAYLEGDLHQEQGNGQVHKTTEFPFQAACEAMK